MTERWVAEASYILTVMDKLRRIQRRGDLTQGDILYDAVLSTSSRNEVQAVIGRLEGSWSTSFAKAPISWLLGIVVNQDS